MDIKRQRTAEQPLRRRARASKIFSPFRTVGLVTNSVPCAVAVNGQAFTVSTVVGRSIQVYDAASLRLLFMTQPQTAEDIECIAAQHHFVFAVNGSTLGVYKRGRVVAEETIPHKERNKALKICVFGGFICVATKSQVSIFKWAPKEAKLEFYTTLTTGSVLGNIVDICHMPTYLNKLTVATQSCIVIFNVKTGKEVFSSQEIPQGIIKVEACPTALDVAAVACENGDLVFLNLRVDRQLFTLQTGETITTMSFRSDTGPASAPLFGIGTANGDLFFYDLGLKRRVQSLRGFATQDAQIAGLIFLPNQPIVLVNGADNTVTELVFDPPVTNQKVGAHRARILRRRGGHAAPASCISFTDEEAHFLLSASLDRSLWAFSLRKDSQSHAFGGMQKEVKEVPAITAMAYQAEKQERWDNILTAHKGSNQARTWNAGRGVLGAYTLDTADQSICKSVAISHCGNFGLLGSAKGSITAYNMQSGLLRYEYKGIHASAITGIALTPNNGMLMSASLDGSVQFHTFGQKHQLIAKLDLDLGAVTDMRYHSGSGLLAVSTDTMAIAVIDSSTRRVVREMWGHGNRITSFDFTANGRWIISASLDSTIRTWDIPTGACIDAVRVEMPATQLRVSPNNEWIATVHVRGAGIQMWAMRSHTEGITFKHVTDEDIETLEMPTASGETGVSLLEGAFGTADDSEASVDVDFDEPAPISDQLEPGLVTLSGQPTAKFTTLVNLDAIRERNKPTEAVKKPEKVPFFLGLPSNDDDTGAADERSGLTSSNLSAPDTAHVSKFTHLLNAGMFGELVHYLKELGPAATDLEIRSLDIDAPYSELIAFIDAMTAEVSHGRNFELVQAWMGILLRAHSEVFLEGATLEPERVGALSESFGNYLEAQRSECKRVQEETRFCSGVLDYLKQL